MKSVVVVAAICGFLLVLGFGRVPDYPLSLSIWGVPVLLMTAFLHGKGLMSPLVRKSLVVSLLVIAVLGSLLDLLFARWFFVFPDSGAVLGLRIDGIPVEEFGFYVLGGWFIALAYVLCDEFWLRRYNRPDGDYSRWARRVPRLFLPSRKGMLLVLLLAGLGIAAKRVLNPQGLPVPGYFLFLLAVAYVPFFLFERAVRSFVNWRGYGMTLSVVLGISILWEVTLAIPGGWWGYQEGAMLGIFVAPWSRLPLEAVTVWFFCSFTVLLYEAAKMFFHRRATRIG